MWRAEVSRKIDMLSAGEAIWKVAEGDYSRNQGRYIIQEQGIGKGRVI